MGKLIVIEGLDGSGKATQTALLCKALEEMGIRYRHITFPDYQDSSSTLVKMYLSGELGGLGEVNAWAASLFYAVDRYASYKKAWGEYYEKGGLVLSDRYTTSNAVHQASKVPEDKREEFLGWLGEFEYVKLGLPQPNIVFWLDMPIQQAVANLRSREAATHTAADIHEVDTAYLETCYATAKQAAEFSGWKRISCINTAGKLRSPEEIHQEIMTLL